jgi:hypothetical protein
MCFSNSKDNTKLYWPTYAPFVSLSVARFGESAGTPDENGPAKRSGTIGPNVPFCPFTDDKVRYQPLKPGYHTGTVKSHY